jgi:hypothetical protein
MGVYHIYSSDDDFDATLTTTSGSSDDLGSEFDVAYNYQITKGLGLLLKGAWYSQGDVKAPAYTDTDKYWVQLDYKFHTSY